MFGFILCLVSLTRLVLQTVTTGKSSGNTGVLVELISTYQNFKCGKHTHIPKKPHYLHVVTKILREGALEKVVSEEETAEEDRDPQEPKKALCVKTKKVFIEIRHTFENQTC